MGEDISTFDDLGDNTLDEGEEEHNVKNEATEQL